MFDQKLISQIEGDMGVIPGSIMTLSWLLMLECYEGRSLKEAGEIVGLSEEEVKVVVENTTADRILELDNGEELGDDARAEIMLESSEDIWARGVLSLKILKRSVLNKIGDGWDDIEAVALDKLGKGLDSMVGNGDPMEMLKIASAANKAHRARDRGTRNGSGTGGPPVLQVGSLGVVQLNLSPATIRQMESKSFVDPEEAAEDKVMITIEETRGLLGESDAEAKAQPQSLQEYLES